MEVFKASIVIPFKTVLANLKFNKHITTLDLKTERFIKESIQKSFNLVTPQAHYGDFLLASVQDKAVAISGFPRTIESQSIARLLKKSSKVTLFAVTIGDNLSREIERASLAGNMTEAIVFDAIGSTAVEEVTESLNNVLQSRAQLEGYRLTKRFSPGYGDFGLSYQRDIVTLLKGEELGIRLTESFIMLPEKSVTAILGWEK